MFSVDNLYYDQTKNPQPAHQIDQIIRELLCRLQNYGD